MTVLITGASGGLGRAMATECASRGYDLFLTDLSDARLAEIKQGIVRQYSVAVYTKSCDVTVPAEVEELAGFVIGVHLEDLHRLRVEPEQAWHDEAVRAAWSEIGPDQHGLDAHGGEEDQ